MKTEGRGRGCRVGGQRHMATWACGQGAIQSNEIAPGRKKKKNNDGGMVGGGDGGENEW